MAKRTRSRRAAVPARRPTRVAATRRTPRVAEVYTHPDQSVPMRPEVGTQAQFRKKKPPVTYRYDSSLSPALDWDGNNGAREMGEWLLRVIETAAALEPPHELPIPADFKAADGRVLASVRSLQEAVDLLRRLSGPFLNWTGKAERLSFDVPTLPLFVHERLSTKAIVETLGGHKSDRQADFWSLLGDPRHSVTDQVLKAYEYFTIARTRAIPTSCSRRREGGGRRTLGCRRQCRWPHGQVGVCDCPEDAGGPDRSRSIRPTRRVKAVRYLQRSPPAIFRRR